MKMKTMLFLMLSITFLFANNLIVKDANVTLLINGQKIELTKDQNLTLDTGTMVCFFEGNGKVIINNIKQLDKNSPDCYQIPVKDDFDIKSFLSSPKNKSISTSIGSSPDSSEVVIHRGAEAADGMPEPEIITVSSSDKEVVIYDETFGPLPVTLSIKKSDGTMVKEVVNEENIKTFFRVPTAYLENNSKIEVTNAFGDKLLNQQVTIDSTSKPEEKHNQVYYEKENHTIVDILYGTDRKINPENSDWEDYYTEGRDKLQLGVAQVSIPKKHKFGEMERPNRLLFWQKEKIGEHVVVVKLKDINKKDFTKLLSNKLKNVTEKDILIFIHGFNVTFASAIRRTAQISYDLQFKGVPMTYSWPSQGDVNSYMKDESSIQYTVPQLLIFLQTIIENREDANIHIIGHSMGTRALTNALKEISYIYPNKPVFKNIILAAPDIDKDVFIGLLPFITKTTEQITLYASSDDTALKLSQTLHSGGRIGQGGDDIFVIENLDTIDATGVDTSLLGHSYFAEKEVLLNDLKDVIEKSLPPTKRKSLIEKIKSQLAYWKFKFENL